MIDRPLARCVLLLPLTVAACAPAEPTAAPSVVPAAVTAGPSPQVPAATSLDAARVGADTIGDSLYPTLGNLGYDVTAYDVHVTADPSVAEATIYETITARATRDLDRFSLDYTGIPVARVLVDGSPARFQAAEGNLDVTPRHALQAGASFTVAVAISGAPTGVRSVAGWQHTDGQIVAFGIYDGLPSWLPSNGDPADKAIVDLWLDVPSQDTGIGSGILVESRDAGARRTYHWRMGETNTMSLVVRPYDSVSLGSPLGFPITSFVPPDLGERQRAKLDVVPRLLGILQDRFGAYPYEALTFAWVEHSTGVPDEGLVLWGADFAEPVDLAHVLCHLWFSTNASPARPADSWLRSAFANYGNLLWYEADGGVEARDRIIAVWHRRLGARTEIALRTDVPRRQPDDVRARAPGPARAARAGRRSDVLPDPADVDRGARPRLGAPGRLPRDGRAGQRPPTRRLVASLAGR